MHLPLVSCCRTAIPNAFFEPTSTTRRLANVHSKSWKHPDAALALYLAFYNYVRPHMTIKTTPAVAAGIADHPWTMEELLTAVAG